MALIKIGEKRYIDPDKVLTFETDVRAPHTKPGGGVATDAVRIVLAGAAEPLLLFDEEKDAFLKLVAAPSKAVEK